jgi:antitoxin (DNA-binding transcriptional repressor) of toxin-antitoxin stability system
MSAETQLPIIITVEQLEADSNHYLWRAEHGEVFNISRDGVVFATLAPPSKKGSELEPEF